MENTEKLTLPEQLDYVIDNLFDNISAGKDLDNIERFIYDFYKGVELKISLSAALSDPSILKERKPITATEAKLNTEVNESPKSKPKKSKKNTEEISDIFENAEYINRLEKVIDSQLKNPNSAPSYSKEQIGINGPVRSIVFDILESNKTPDEYKQKAKSVLLKMNKIIDLMEESEEKPDTTQPHQEEKEEIDITQPPMPEPAEEKNNDGKLPPEEVEKIFENYITGIASKIDGYDEARKASIKDYIIQTINSGNISVKLQEKGWEVINKIDPVTPPVEQQAVKINPVFEGGCEFCTAPEGPIQKRICSSEQFNGATMCAKCYNAFVDNKSVITESTTLDEAIDKLEESEKPKQIDIDNHDIPETSQEDKENDAVFAANAILQQAICDQFKTISLIKGITEETFGLWVAFLKLNMNENGIITDTTRLMTYVQNQNDIKYFADRFNERLKAARSK